MARWGISKGDEAAADPVKFGARFSKKAATARLAVTDAGPTNWGRNQLDAVDESYERVVAKLPKRDRPTG